jgi:nucleoside-diphosphate-sugar epimerase
MSRHPKRPRDPNQLAKLIVDLASGGRTEVKPAPPTPGQEFARSGGLVGGKARANALTPEHRAQIAQTAALARWAKKRDMLGLAKRIGAKVLQASTSEVYGDPTVHPQTEDYRGNVTPLGPRACCDEGKRCAETLFFDYLRQHRTRIKVVRIFNTYGPNMHPNDGRVVSNFIVQALRGEDITLFGDGSQTRAFCYVSDLIEGWCA